MNSRGAHILTTLVFAGILVSAGGIQLGISLARGKTPGALELFTAAPTAPHLRAYEQRLEDESWLAKQLRPWMQYARFVLFGDSGEKAILGRNGWFFYKPGVEYLTQREVGASREEDPVVAICDFRDQLAARGIHLLVMPAPNKESVYPEELSRRAAHLRGAMCEQTRSLLSRLRESGVEVVDLFEVFSREKSRRVMNGTRRLYLAQDSHWSPAGLQLAAQAVAQRLRQRGWLAEGKTAYRERSVPIAHLGDIVRMLRVPQIEARVAPEHVECAQIALQDTSRLYEDDPRAQVLVLGDSFLRIFQQDEPGAAGFIAHLASELGRPVASIVNDGGASTLVRQELYRRPALLANRKVVIWEFVERDIRFGTEGWQLVPLP